MESLKEQPVFKRILCSVDLTGDIWPALRLSRRLAERNGAKLILIQVITQRVPGGVVLREECEAARVALKEMVADQLSGIDYELVVSWGDPAREIVTAEKRFGAELCVLATSGELGSARLLRSAAEKVARRSQCPVLTVPIAGASAKQEILSTLLQSEG